MSSALAVRFLTTGPLQKSPFAHFLVGLFSYCWNFKAFYIVNKSSLSDTCFANIFSYTVLFILLSIFHKAKAFNFGKVKLI